jgi:hypothetical protein
MMIGPWKKKRKGDGVKNHSQYVVDQSWLQILRIHDIRAQHILLSAVHDRTLMPNGI